MGSFTFLIKCPPFNANEHTSTRAHEQLNFSFARVLAYAFGLI